MPLAAFANAARGGTILDKIASPPQLNLLGDYNAAADAAGRIYDLSARQGQQVWGDAMMQSIDPQTGQPDFQKAARIAQASGNSAAGYYAPTALNTISNLTGAQLEQQQFRTGLHARAAMSLAQDPSDENLARVRDQLIANQFPRDQVMTEYQRWQGMSQGDRVKSAFNEATQALDTATSMGRVYGGTTMKDFGGESRPVTQVQPSPYMPGGYIGVGGAIPHAMSPDTLYGTIYNFEDDQGQKQHLTLDQFIRWQAAGGHVGGAITLTTPGSSGKPGAPAQGTPGSPGAPSPKAPASVTPPKPQSSLPIPPIPPAPVSDGPNLLQPPDLSRPVNVASMDSRFAPATGPAAPPSPGAYSAADAISAGMRGAGAGGAPGPVQTAANTFLQTPPNVSIPPGMTGAPPVGAGPPRSVPGVDQDNAARWARSRDMYNADNAASASYVSRTFPLVQALHILESNPDLKTGAGAEAFNQIKSFLSFMLPKDAPDIQGVKEIDKLGKYYNQILMNNPAFAHSDMALGTALGGSPNMHLTANASTDVMKGMTALERMKQMALIDFKAQGGRDRDWTDYLSNYQTTHDPRAFVYDMLAPDKQQALLASLDGNSPAKQRERQSFSDTLTLIKQHPEILATSAMP